MSKQVSYKYRFSRKVWIYSMVYLLGFILLAIALYFLYEGDYISAWFSSSIIALLLLLSLSIPRKVVLGERTLRIYCLMDLTELEFKEIASVRRVANREMKGFVPLFAGFGFFGYYGHYLDVIQVERVLIYASEWDNFVEITDIYERRIYLSCTEADDLVAEIEKRIA
ncbi:MAG: PH domain-containing protein [Alistipes sp.]|nr:PH domain-containing protein [Alistipes sp.]